ncbi:MAG: altronate hydrolase [Streptosporangiales bacterium]|nr:altronate hydrolase [Streptosporangiales bacterium]
MTAVEFDTVAVLPEPGDNVAIVSADLPAGTVLDRDGPRITVAHQVLEGHRIVVQPIADGEPLLSWSTPFAYASGDLAAGDYVCTETTLQALRTRGVEQLPDQPTAVNRPLDPFRLDESQLVIGRQVDPVEQPATFLGYPRAAGPAGTRNHAVVVGTTSRTGPFVTELARRFAGRATGGCDGVVPVAHTEGGEDTTPNNADFVLRALAGFLVHPNVGAVLVVDEPGAAITGSDVTAFMAAHGYPEIAVPHAFFTRAGSFSGDLAAAAEHVEAWLPALAAQERTEQPLSDLKIALQCGGSDAFSGITANPLAGAVAREVIRHGGAAVLAETDELIGAEGYVLENVRDVEVARRFLRTVESFKERASWHGHTAEGNPSGGNIYRGLYNIVLKSVGAARKRDRQLRLDRVVDYAEPLPGPGFVFMDSPGNDLESVAGEVASGCTMIFFTTGNGSITNFPFVPTLKFVTTTPRYELLRHEMDVDAGRYLTGTSMAELTAETFDLTLATASGARSAGERAGHSQVSIWRNWQQTEPRQAVSVSIGRAPSTDDEMDTELDGKPLQVPMPHDPPAPSFIMYAAEGSRAPEQLALVLPTSLCSGQIGLRLADLANRQNWYRQQVSRAVSLAHTEGCGVASGSAEHTYARVMTGYLTHPSVRMALLLEHGCEKTHNDYFRSRLVEQGVDPTSFGWASIQLDGGIDAVTAKVRDWFEATAGALDAPARMPAGLGDLSVALEARGPMRQDTAVALATVGSWIVASGGTVVLTSAGKLLADADFRRHAFGSTDQVSATLAHGQRPAAPGWHVMRTPTTDWTETGSGLGATGAQLLLTHVAGGTVSGQPLLPVAQVTADPWTDETYGQDLDGVLRGDADRQALDLLGVVAALASGERAPRTLTSGNVGFQITRGLLGVSM